MNGNKRSVAFALVILQRRLASSTYTIFKSLERRKKRLEELIKGAERTDATEKVFDFDEVEDMSEEDRWKEELWETLSVAENKQELEREILTLGALIDNYIEQPHISKAGQLLRQECYC
jgi:hypothetical protein